MPVEGVQPVALEVPRDIANNVGPMSAALSKRLLWDTARYGFAPQQVAAYETELHHRVMGTADASEGVRAFLEHRDPQWVAGVGSDWKDLPWS